MSANPGFRRYLREARAGRHARIRKHAEAGTPAEFIDVWRTPDPEPYGFSAEEQRASLMLRERPLVDWSGYTEDGVYPDANLIDRRRT